MTDTWLLLNASAAGFCFAWLLESIAQDEPVSVLLAAFFCGANTIHAIRDARL